MMAPTGNKINQTKHGPYNAVDYDNEPDPDFYAPENGTITAYIPNNGDCGNSLKMQGGTGLHGFCHLEKPYVRVGQSVTKGQRIGRMGFTGYTQPDNVPAGTHLHWIILRNGVYVYPPILINEPFKKEGGEMPITQGQLDKLIKMAINREPTAAELGNKAYADNPGLAIDTFWENGGKQSYGIPPSEAEKKLNQIKSILG